MVDKNNNALKPHCNERHLMLITSSSIIESVCFSAVTKDLLRLRVANRIKVFHVFCKFISTNYMAQSSFVYKLDTEILLWGPPHNPLLPLPLMPKLCPSSTKRTENLPKPQTKKAVEIEK